LAVSGDQEEKKSTPSSESLKKDRVRAGERTSVLGKGWKKSADRAWTTTGDARGFHILTAQQKQGYAWKTTATLAEPGFDTNLWVGNACVTGSGKRALVVYAPKSFTNDVDLRLRGAFAAVVELATGRVTKLDVQVSLSHYNPGCGVGETAVLTQSGDKDLPGTRLIRVDAATGKLSPAIRAEGQVTSAVPAKDGSIVAAAGAQVVRIGRTGNRSALAHTNGVPYYLTADADGGVVFLDKAPSSSGGPSRPRSGLVRAIAASPQTEVKRITAREIRHPKPKKAARTALAAGPATATGLTRDAMGTVYVTGEKTETAQMPDVVRPLPGTPRGASVTTKGEAVLTKTAWADGEDSRVASTDTVETRPVDVTLQVRRTRKRAEFTIDPAAAPAPYVEQGTERSPKLPGAKKDADGGGDEGDAGEADSRSGSSALSTSSFDGDRYEIVESERVCSVPRNDPHNQAIQPKPRQVEWAVNRAVKGELNQYVSRPADWKNLGMPAYQPQTLFPRVPLEGGGFVPHQVMLGITAAESNMQQASRVAVPGVSANPKLGNYYGIDYYDGEPLNDWDIDWAEADCGYGVTQVTDHMRLAGREGGGLPAWDYQKQRAVALDYAVNIAAGLQILAGKWNQTRRAGMVVNNGDVSKIENWYFALWAYNSGFYPDNGDGSPWGVGWANNPANPEWDAGRTPFMEDALGHENPHDAAHPQDWPYQEKVIGFAAHPPAYLESPGTMVGAFRPAWWNGTDGAGDDATVPGSALYNRARAKAPEGLFCTAANDCDPSMISDGASNDDGAGPCTRSDYKCWWHKPVTWKDDCDYTCGNHFRRFPDGWAEEPFGDAYPPACTTAGLPADARIVDDVPDGSPVVRTGCSNGGWSNAGDFQFDFGEGESGGHPSNAYTRWPSKVDTHQLGAGFGGHFYFNHTRKNHTKGQRLKATGTWTWDEELNGPAKVYVHLPDHGAHTRYADYRVYTAKGIRHRTLQQPGEGNRWVPLGAFLFDGRPKVKLDTITPDGTGDEDIAFDAVAVAPIDGQYVEETVESLGYFDEDQNLDGGTWEWLTETPFENRQSLHDWGVQTSERVLNLPTCTAGPELDCAMPETKAAMQRWHGHIVAAGTHPTDHPDGESIPTWMHFANDYRERPSGITKPDSFDAGDTHFKIRTKVKLSYIEAGDGTIVEGSEYAQYESRTGDTTIPDFVWDTFVALQEDYGISMPDLNFTAVDLNEHNGQATTTNTNATRILPGREYAEMGKRPVITDAQGNPAAAGSGTCVRGLYTAGGSIGYRPMLASDDVNSEIEEWKAGANPNVGVPAEVQRLVAEIYNALFKQGTFGSLFNHAAPIWHELNLLACTDGKIRQNQGVPVLRSSHMPNQYLYRNDRAMELDGTYSATGGPVRRGNYESFTNATTLEQPDTAFGDCGHYTGQGGNPWNLGGTDSAGANPEGHFCFDRDLEPDPQFSK
jgi:hypothetical protein